MNHLKKHITAVFENAPAANFRDANFDALVRELHSATNPRDTHDLGLLVLALLSAHLKSSLLAEKALSRAMGGPSE